MGTEQLSRILQLSLDEPTDALQRKLCTHADLRNDKSYNLHAASRQDLPSSRMLLFSEGTALYKGVQTNAKSVWTPLMQTKFT